MFGIKKTPHEKCAVTGNPTNGRKDIVQVYYSQNHYLPVLPEAFSEEFYSESVLGPAIAVSSPEGKKDIIADSVAFTVFRRTFDKQLPDGEARYSLSEIFKRVRQYTQN